MKPINIAITAACFSGNKGAAAMLQSSIKQLRERYGEKLNIFLMSTYPGADRKLIAEMPEKYDFIKVVNAKPERLLFLAFPLPYFTASCGSFRRSGSSCKWIR